MADALANEPLALEVKKLTKVFGDRKALDNVSFSLPQGAFLSIFGPNGAGKTTMLRMLSTLARPTSGTIRVMGIDAKEDPDKVRDHIGLISHNSMLYPDLTAMENMMFVARLYGVVDPEARVRELLRAVELDHRRFDSVRTFSRGMTQRVSIARALVNDPAFVNKLREGDAATRSECDHRNYCIARMYSVDMKCCKHCGDLPRKIREELAKLP